MGSRVAPALDVPWEESLSHSSTGRPSQGFRSTNQEEPWREEEEDRIVCLLEDRGVPGKKDVVDLQDIVVIQ